MKISLHTEVCDKLGIEYPIFAFNHCRDVTAAVCNAGGIGILGVTGKTFEEKRVEVEWLRNHTDKPFGLDVLLPQANPEGGNHEELMTKVPLENIEYMIKLRTELGLPEGYVPQGFLGDSFGMGVGGTIATQMEEVEAICELKPNVFAAGLGVNAKIVEMCHKAGIKVISLVGNVKQARRVAGYGVDIIVAQGTESGGHTGRIGTMVLTPLVVDAVKPVPVLAAGGIADGRGLVAALALGAAGVWTGTLWLYAHENPLEDFIKDRIVNATEEDAVITKCLSGKTARTLKTKFIEYWEKPDAPKVLPPPYQMIYIPLPWTVTSEDVDRTWERLGLHDWVGTACGQAIGLINQRKPARTILYDMVAQAVDVLGD